MSAPPVTSASRPSTCPGTWARAGRATPGCGRRDQSPPLSDLGDLAERRREQLRHRDPASDTASRSPEAVSEAGIGNAFKVKMTFVGLSSYDGAGKALKAVVDGVAACSDGFVTTGRGERQRITKVAAGKASGAGDEALAFSADADMDGAGSAAFNTGVGRVGNTVATHCTVGFGTLAAGEAAAVPTAVIEAQTNKLR
jgi:hypothetical protein